VHLVLSSIKLARVKQDQIAWLKKRDATNSTAEKCKLTEERIKGLRELVSPGGRESEEQWGVFRSVAILTCTISCGLSIPLKY
jgi:hypothetical protein